MIDKKGFRSNVGIVLINAYQQVFWGRRVGGFDAWQFPQGGIMTGETEEQAMYRELHEELGLLPQHVQIVDVVKPWLYYRLPYRLRRHHSKPVCVGQKQKWFLLRLSVSDSTLDFNKASKPEFDDFAWVTPEHAIKHVVYFKRKVYKKAFRYFKPHLKAASQSIDLSDDKKSV